MRMTGSSLLGGYTNTSAMSMYKTALNAKGLQTGGRTNQSIKLLGGRGLSSFYTREASKINSLFEKTKETAQGLREHGQKLMESGEGSLFAEAEKKGDTSGIVEEIDQFVDDYNAMVKNMKKTGGTANNAYAAEMKKDFESCKEALEAIGITAGEDGTLKVDKDTLSKADIASLKSAFGSSASFGGKASAKSLYVEANAVSGQAAASANYGKYASAGYGNYAGGYGNDLNSMIGSLFQSMS